MKAYGFVKALMVTFLLSACTVRAESSRMLIFNKYPGVLHRGTISRTTAMVDSIAGVLQTFEWDSTSDSTFITTENLDGYDILFLNNNQQPAKLLSVEQQSAIEEFVRNGGSVMGCHSSINMAKKIPWPFLVDSVFGAEEEHHHPVYEVDVVLDEEASVLVGVEDLTTEFRIHNQWYTLQPNPRDVEGVHVIYSLVESTFVNTKDEPLENKMYMGDHPIAWVRDLPTGGRVFYTEITHHREFVEPDNELYPTVFSLYKEGIRYLLETSSSPRIKQSASPGAQMHRKPTGSSLGLSGFGKTGKTPSRSRKYIVNGREVTPERDVSAGTRLEVR